jgi:hypothetical protein
MTKRSTSTGSKRHRGAERIVKPAVAQLEALGLKVLRFEINKHAKLYVATPRGDEFHIVCSTSPSDFRVRNNFTRDVKKAMRKQLGYCLDDLTLA